MKPGRSYQPHLVLEEIVLAPGREWSFQSPGWTFLQISSGAGYWLDPRSYHELPAGSSLMVSDQRPGAFRASQVAGVVFRFVRIIPERLGGLVTLSDQQFLQNAARQEGFAVRFFPPADPVAERFSRLCGELSGDSLVSRLRLFDFFIGAFGEDLGRHQPKPAQNADARVRLVKVLGQTASAELSDMKFAELVQAVQCTPRHLSRTFQQVVGMSFREKQAELRLARAQELLATTRSKVLEVALESGYQSASLFNLMFKRRYGVSPGKWRESLRETGCSRSRKLAVGP